MEKIKVVWICAFSNAQIREHYQVKSGRFMQLVKKLYVGKTSNNQDYAQWNTNGIAEMEKIDEVELHVVSPIRHLSKKEVRFECDGVHYYFFRDENSSAFRFLYYQLFTKNKSMFKRNRSYAKRIISEINPDLVHVIGAENPYYSTILLDIPESIPTIVQLQTLLSKAVYETKVPKERKSFSYKSRIEKLLFTKATYIGTNVGGFVDYIKVNILNNAKFLRLSLALTEPVDFSYKEKKYDFVYFASGIQKAVDVAIEAFALAYQKDPSLSLDIVGGYTTELKKKLDTRILELGIGKAVTFEGKLATHEDVIKQIKLSRFALLPLKIDVISGTIREAMANGLPVVTTITEGGTPKLNEKRESVLLSAQGDYQAMANNMLKLVDDPDYAKMIQTNAGLIAKERISNEHIIKTWVEAYHACIAEARDNTPIPEHLIIY